MTINDLLYQEEIRQTIPQIRENEIAEKVLKKYLGAKPQLFEYDFIEQLLYLYFSIDSEKYKKKLEKILKDYGFNEVLSIHNAMYYLLGKKKELGFDYTSPMLWPGIYDIKRESSRYNLTTSIGNITVYKASIVFKGTNSYSVFRKQLIGQCYARTYDFLKKNRDYKAVLSYQPNFFYEGHYHAYLESDEHVLDIACNAFYDSKEDANRVLSGEIIKKLSYDEVEDECGKLSNEIGYIKNSDKLNVLTLYYDRTAK